MLIKRTERQARRGTLAAALAQPSGGGLDRRTFLRRSGLAAGGLAALGALPLGGVRKAEAGPPPPAGAQVTIRKNICTHCSVGCTVDRRGRERRVDRPGAGLGQPDQPRLALRQGRRDARARARRPPPALPDEDGQRPMAAHLLGAGDQRDRRQADGDPREVRARIRSTGSARPSSPTRAPISTASSRPSGAPTTSITRRASATRPPSRASPIPGATAR